MSQVPAAIRHTTGCGSAQNSRTRRLAQATCHAWLIEVTARCVRLWFAFFSWSRIFESSS